MCSTGAVGWFDDWDTCAYFARLLDGQHVAYKVFELQSGVWVALVTSE